MVNAVLVPLPLSAEEAEKNSHALLSDALADLLGVSRRAMLCLHLLLAAISEGGSEQPTSESEGNSWQLE